jgi:hypothetical protein
MADDAAPAEQPVEQAFIYDAFISYRHVDRDRKWAEWLIAALEGYRVPKALQERGLPPRLRKIFRDEDELPSSADLNDQIKAALRASRFLIVVCSAFTPRSKWVEREIEMFNELGRGDQVLALLTEGEPADSFPDAMLYRRREVVDPDGSKRIVKEDKEPLAADVRPRPGVSSEASKRFALLRLVAVILGVKFDDLRQREQERGRKRQRTWAAIAAALVLLIGGSGGFYWDMMRPKTSYYRDLVWRWGLPEGAHEIDAQTRALLGGDSYSVVSQRGKVIEARRDDYGRYGAAGQARWVVHYGDDGNAQKVEVFDAHGRLIEDDVLRREASGKNMIVSSERHGIPVAQGATRDLDMDTGKPAPTQNKSEITRHELTFDAHGFPVEVRYQDNWGTPQHDSQDSFGERYTYAPDGLVVRSSEIGANDQEITLKNGVRAVTSAYDGEGRLLQQTLLGEDGRAINGPDGYDYYIQDYEAAGHGNVTAKTYYGADGKPTISRDGYSRLVPQYDEHGNNIEQTYYGVDGKPAVYKYGYALVKQKFDDRGNAVEVAFFGVDGRPTFDTLGAAGERRAFDQNGNLIEADYFDTDGKSTIGKEGFATIKKRFDARGNQVEEAYFGIDGKLTVSKAGIAAVHQTFDQHDQRIAIAYFGSDDKPTLNKEGIAKVAFTYDARSNLIESAFFEANGRPVLSPQGYAGFRQSYDDRGNLIETSYFGPSGEPVLGKEDGAATIRYAYDAHGNETERAYFGVDRRPVLATGGFATLRSAYDDRGQRIEVEAFGIDGRPAATVEGIVVSRLAYDSRGNEVQRNFFGVDGKPTLVAGGDAGYLSKYDDEGNGIETTYLGIDGKPTLTSFGISILRKSFDARHNQVELSYFGVDGKPILSKEGMARATYAYDSRGNLIERAFLGIDDKPTLGTAGYATSRQAFDDRSNLIMRSFFGVDGEPINVHDGGYAKIIWSYDHRSALLAESYFGADGKPAHDDGVVTIKYSHDDEGRQTKVTYLDAQGHELQMELVARRVTPGLLGARAGLEPGDHILAYNGQPVNSIKQLNDLTASGNATFRTLTVRRGSEVITLQVPFKGALGINIGLDRVVSRNEAGDSTPTPSDATR